MASPDETRKPRAETIAGLDTIRFVAATCVVFSHGALFPVASYVPERTGMWRVIVGLNASMYNGVAAVLVFFVVSGFCIHYRFAAGAPFRTTPFLARRLLRIAIPMIGAFAIARIFGAAAIGALDEVIWTLYCELIYYALYPLLRIGFRQFGLVTIAVASSAISIALVLLQWKFGFYWQFTIFLTWLVCLPVWLVGCLLAEITVARKLPQAGGAIWIWRLVGWTYAAFAFVYFFHGPIKIGYPALLAPFSLYLLFWMGREIAYFQQFPPPRLLEWAGQWSYSIYLMHGTVLVLFLPLATTWDPAALWIAKLVGIFLVSYVFYQLIERPARNLARGMSKYLAGKPSVLKSP